jgi:hypothetical protein
MKVRLLILLFLELVFLAGCRAGVETSRFKTRTSIDEIGVELRRVDSLWSSFAEKTTYKIEFYPPISDSFSVLPPPAAPAANGLANVAHPGSVTGGIGAVKSVEFSTERNEDRSSITATDSVAEQKNVDQEALQKEASSEARQDNGTVTIVSVVAAVAVLLFLIYLSLKYLKK